MLRIRKHGDLGLQSSSAWHVALAPRGLHSGLSGELPGLVSQRLAPWQSILMSPRRSQIMATFPQASLQTFKGKKSSFVPFSSVRETFIEQLLYARHKNIDIKKDTQKGPLIIWPHSLNPPESIDHRGWGRAGSADPY